jgi:hypothetical protein
MHCRQSIRTQQTTQDLLKISGFDNRRCTSFKYGATVTKEHGVLDSMVQWCQDNTSDDWGWHIDTTSGDHCPGVYQFYFDNEKDSVAFVLTWC